MGLILFYAQLDLPNSEFQHYEEPQALAGLLLTKDGIKRGRRLTIS